MSLYKRSIQTVSNDRLIGSDVVNRRLASVTACDLISDDVVLTTLRPTFGLQLFICIVGSLNIWIYQTIVCCSSRQSTLGRYILILRSLDLAANSHLQQFVRDSHDHNYLASPTGLSMYVRIINV